MVVLVRRANVQISRFNAEQEGVGEELFFGPTLMVKNCVDQGTEKGISCEIINPGVGNQKFGLQLCCSYTHNTLHCTC